MQAEIIHPDIKNNRMDEIDLAKNSSIKSISASTFQMRFLDTISGYMFIISASNLLDQRKLDNKLDQIYKTFVDFVIKAPFFNVTPNIPRAPKRSTTRSSSKNAMRYCILFDSASQGCPLYILTWVGLSFQSFILYGRGDREPGRD